VCLLPGTEVVFEKAVECRAPWLPLLRPKQVMGERVARFRQVNMDQRNVHHDALEFADGKIILLNSLYEGQEATVLQLPAQPQNAAEMTVQERVAQVD
jgi:hypothetical protein